MASLGKALWIDSLTILEISSGVFICFLLALFVFNFFRLFFSPADGPRHKVIINRLKHGFFPFTASENIRDATNDISNDPTLFYILPTFVDCFLLHNFFRHNELNPCEPDNRQMNSNLSNVQLDQDKCSFDYPFVF